MSKIIVSYRRSDSAAIAGRIFDRLTSHFGEELVFMDIDKIPFGTDFRKHIQGVLEGGGILLAVVGPNWLGKTTDGNRMKDEADPVRVEVEAALRQGMTVLPVLVDGAAMPGAADLPESMREFAFINAAPVDIGRDFRQHMDRVIRAIDEILTPRAAAPTQRKGRTPLRLAAAIGTVALAALAGGVYWIATKPIAVSGSATVADTSARIEVSRAAPRSDGSTASGAQMEVSRSAPATNETAPPRSAEPSRVALPPAAASYRVLPNVSGGVQNLRGGPAVKYPLVVAIPAGATGLTIGACRASEDGTRPWCAATWRTYSGWISSCCVVDEKTGAPPRID